MNLNERKTALLALLKDPSGDVRKAASDALAAVETSEQLGSIMQRLKSPERQEQVEAVYALRYVVTEEGGRLIAQLCAHPVVDIRSAALRVVLESRRFKLAVHALDRVKDPVAAVGVLAVKVLAESGDRAFEPVLLGLLRDVGDEVKAEILRALMRYESAQALPMAVKALRSPSAVIRVAAAEIIGRMPLTAEESRAAAATVEDAVLNSQ